MKKSSNIEPVFVEYDDNNMSHVLPGPDYGQPSSSSAWLEKDSKEYIDFVHILYSMIINNPVKLNRS